MTTIRLRLSGEDPMWVFTTSSGKPGAVTNYFPEPLGLDGRFRVAAPNRFGIAAARGRWASDISFEIERRILGGSVTQHSILTFEGNNVTVHFVDTDGRKRIYTDAPNERRSFAAEADEEQIPESS